MIDFFTSTFFVNYLLFFSVFAITLWIYYYFGLYGLSNPIPNQSYTKRVCAVIPTYNESQENLIDTIYCIKNCKEIEDFVFVDDGSKNNVSEVLKQFLPKENYIIADKNGGKREAQAIGMRHFVNKYSQTYFDSVVMLDSDTTFKEDAIEKLLRRMSKKNMGAVTANVQVKNREDNFLTRCLSAMYWSSSNIWRQAPANYGYMQVTNGQLSVYKFKPIYELLPIYLTQTFWGQKCAFSDDRWFTQHLQTDYSLLIDYEKESIAYTYVPNTFKSCWKMFLRWKKGSLRETLLVSKHITTNPMLVLDCWWNHLVSLFQVTIRVSVIILTFFFPMVLLYYLGVVCFISLIYGFNMIVENPREIPFRLGYSMLNEFIFGWQIIIGIYQIRNQGWATR